jgi:hypothetical protein
MSSRVYQLPNGPNGTSLYPCPHIILIPLCQRIVVHFHGVSAAIYLATFPWDYLHRLRNVNIDSLKDLEKIPLHHSKLYNLLNTDSRTEFIRHMVALIRMVAAGDANVGHLRKDAGKVHREENSSGNAKNESVLHLPQEEMDEMEESRWKEVSARGVHCLVLVGQWDIGVWHRCCTFRYGWRAESPSERLG